MADTPKSLRIGPVITRPGLSGQSMPVPATVQPSNVNFTVSGTPRPKSVHLDSEQPAGGNPTNTPASPGVIRLPPADISVPYNGGWGSVIEWCARELGVNLRQTLSRITVPTTGVTLAGPNGDRFWISIVNTGTNSLTIQWDNLDTSLSGLVLGGGGGTYGVNARDDFGWPIQPHYAFAPVAQTTALVATLERV